MSDSTKAPIGSVGWGWWPMEGNTVVHVAPAYKGGDIIPPHVLSPTCPCGPREEYTSKGIKMWVHEQIQ